jgi:hypothetical protein
VKGIERRRLQLQRSETTPHERAQRLVEHDDQHLGRIDGRLGRLLVRERQPRNAVQRDRGLTRARTTLDDHRLLSARGDQPVLRRREQRQDIREPLGLRGAAPFRLGRFEAASRRHEHLLAGLAAQRDLAHATLLRGQRRKHIDDARDADEPRLIELELLARLRLVIRARERVPPIDDPLVWYALRTDAIFLVALVVA